MAVGLGQVEPAVVVGVEGDQTEAEHLRVAAASPAAVDRSLKIPSPWLWYSVVDSLIEVGHGQVDPAVAVEVATGDAHAGHVAAAGTGRQTGLHSLFDEPEAARLWKK